MASQETEQHNRCEVRIDFASETPVLGCSMTPRVKVTCEGLSNPPTHSLHFTWYRWQDYELLEKCERPEGVTSRYGWFEIASSEAYVPSLGDLRTELKLEAFATDPFTGSPLSSICAAVTQPVLSFPLPSGRRIVNFENSQDMRNIDMACQSSDPFAFSILSYNVLADHLGTIRQYCPLWALTWENRREKLLDEILGYNADILCLQEVQSDHFESFFVPRLHPYGYSGFYVKKEHTTVFVAAGYETSDGCAIFYRRDRFELLWKKELRYRESVESVFPASSLENKDQFRLLKDNVAVVAVFKVQMDPFEPEICIVNTHITANPKISDVKLLQIKTLIHCLEERVSSRIPIVICGDFNSIPNSDCHRFLVKGKLDPPKEAHLDPYGIYKHLKLEHSLQLGSAYQAIFEAERTDEVRRFLSNMDSSSHEPILTTSTPHFAQSLDYILFSEKFLTVQGLLELPSLDPLKDHIPSPRWPSDHLALMACFKYYPKY